MFKMYNCSSWSRKTDNTIIHETASMLTHFTIDWDKIDPVAKQQLYNFSCSKVEQVRAGLWEPTTVTDTTIPGDASLVQVTGGAFTTTYGRATRHTVTRSTA